ncbi:MAG: hypothetical protein Q9227_003072 [Pyrenula ochraceoflavens]
MICGLRIGLGTLLIITIFTIILWRHIADLGDQYSAGAYIRSSLERLTLELPHRQPPVGTLVGDRIIVMAKMEEDDTSWVSEELPDWQRAIYTVNPTHETSVTPGVLTTPLNKGHESMAYLTYVIDHYDRLPSTIAFLHSHRSGFFQAWHVDMPLHDNVAALQTLQLPFVDKSGYVNLRCNWNPGCEKAHRRNKHVTHEIWQEVFMHTSTPPANESNVVSKPEDKNRLFYTPSEVGAACCAQFAVSKEQVRRRPKSDYEKFRKWVIDTEKDDAKSGRVMEFLWHVIFGKGSV